MKTIRVGAAAINTTPLDWEGNLNATLAAICEAADAGVGILCLPEMCLTGYGCEDAFHSPIVQDAVGMSLGALMNLGATLEHERKIIMFCVGVPVLYQHALFNAVAVFRNGTLLGYVVKQHLAGDGLHYEPRWFRPWPAGVRGEVDEVPIGDLVFDFEGLRIGFEICEDAWVADRPGIALARKGVDIILNPSASHFAFGKYAVRERFVTEGSRAFGVTYVYANLLGNEAGRAIYDGDVLIASGGHLVARGKRFSYQRHTLTTAVVDVEATRISQARTASFSPSFDEAGVIQVRKPIRSANASVTGLNVARPPATFDDILSDGDVGDTDWEKLAYSDPERHRLCEFTEAVPLALYDYQRKSGCSGYVVSLSGGADSAACASLVRLMVRHGVKDLGFEAFRKSLHVTSEATSEGDLMRHLLTCVYQASENSSKQTESAAEQIALGLGAEYHSINVAGLISEYTKIVSGALGMDLTWQNADIPLQNIQARVRAPSIWMFANLKNALLMTTGNRSEGSAGYCTMDGDTAGSISAIGGADKPFICNWLHWLEAYDPQFRCLGSMNSHTPTAELRPASQAQTDEKDLMPYDVLNAAEKAAIRDKKSPVDVYRTLCGQFPGHTKNDLGLWVARYFTLWVRNQWKRERLAPSFHIDDENLDPKTWCRFPILSGGFRAELADLREFINAEKGS